MKLVIINGITYEVTGYTTIIHNGKEYQQEIRRALLLNETYDKHGKRRWNTNKSF